MPEKKTTTSGKTQWTIIKLIRWATSYLKTHDIDSPRATGEILLAHVLKVKRIDLYLNYDQPLVAEELKTRSRTLNSCMTSQRTSVPVTLF